MKELNDNKNLFDLGNIITTGGKRMVYEHSTNDKWVIKKLKDKDKFNENEIEWNIWNLVKGTKYEPYFCPCVNISDDKLYLIMLKAKTIPFEQFEKDFPLKINNNLKKQLLSININKTLQLPPFLHDCAHNQPHNWGILNDKKVIIDYGHKNNKKLIKYLKKK